MGAVQSLGVQSPLCCSLIADGRFLSFLTVFANFCAWWLWGDCKPSVRRGVSIYVTYDDQ
jgi:hypothetical protein